MAIVNTNWQQFLSPDSELPPDVVFDVEDFNVDDKEDYRTGQVSAHKLLLAGTSPVFRKQFFGAMKEKGDVVKIEGTTKEAFTTMINYIYMAPISVSNFYMAPISDDNAAGSDTFSIMDVTCPQTLCELLNISERYQISGLVEIVKKALKDLPIHPGNMIFTAATAKNYAMFDDVSKLLMEKCQSFVANSLKTADDVFSFMLETKENFPDADPELLHEILRANAEKKKNAARVEVFHPNSSSRRPRRMISARHNGPFGQWD